MVGFGYHCMTIRLLAGKVGWVTTAEKTAHVPDWKAANRCSSKMDLIYATEWSCQNPNVSANALNDEPTGRSSCLKTYGKKPPSAMPMSPP